jgi:hypothetical protein
MATANESLVGRRILLEHKHIHNENDYRTYPAHFHHGACHAYLHHCIHCQVQPMRHTRRMVSVSQTLGIGQRNFCQRVMCVSKTPDVSTLGVTFILSI